MAKKRRSQTSGSAKSPQKASSAKGALAQWQAGAQKRSGKSHRTTGDLRRLVSRRDELPRSVASLLAGLLLLAVTLGYGSGSYAPYYAFRVAFLYPVATLLISAAVWSIARPGTRVYLDWYDVLVLLFCLWQVVCAALSPVPVLAWFGVYNRIGGAVFWITAALLLLSARRVLGGRRCRSRLAVVVSFILIVNGVIAIVQAAGGETPWHMTLVTAGRVSGTTGNPVNLAGLSLLGVWTASLAAGREPFGRGLRLLLMTASAFAMITGMLSVSRAFYLGVGASLVAALVSSSLMRRWRMALTLTGVALVVVIIAAAYTPKLPVAAGGGGAARSGAEAHRRPSSAASRLVAAPFKIKHTGRYELWRIGIKATEARPLTGYGAGAFGVAYNRFVSAGTAQSNPVLSVSDAHGLPLLLLSGTGVPGFLLAAAVLGGAVVLGVGARKRRDPVSAESRDHDALGAAGLFALAVVIYSLVSPTDPVTVIPLVLLCGSELRAPVGGDRLSFALPAAARIPVVSLAAVALLSTWLTSSILGVRLVGADMSFREGSTNHLVATVSRASNASASVPQYALVAGDLYATEAIQSGQGDAQHSAEAMFRRSLHADPSQAAARAELAKLYLSFGRIESALIEIRAGLRFSPHQPILQALWAQAGLYALLKADDRELANRVSSDMNGYPDKVADGWYWLSLLEAELGNDVAARQASAEARRLAPGFGRRVYQKRVGGGISVGET